MPVAVPSPPPLSRPHVVAPGEVIDWSLKRDGRGRVYVSGPFRIILDAATSPEGDRDDRGMFSRIGVSDAAASDDRPPSFTVLNLSGAVGFPDDAVARVAVARLDPDSPAYSVLVTSFTGGAHCCDQVQIATPGRGAAVGLGHLGWTVLRPGEFDGARLGFGPGGAKLAAGADDTFGVSIPDDAFGYAFDCFACSLQPLRIYGLHGGALVERTAEPPFRALLEAEMRTAEAGCRAHGKGVCPAYLADAARLGRWSQAWKVVTASVPAHPDGVSYRLCDGVRVEFQCRRGEPSRPIASYGEAVRLFLKQQGYPVPAK